MQAEVWMRIEEEEPDVIIGSPMCTMFCQMTRIPWNKMKPEVGVPRLKEAIRHSEFVCQICMYQARKGKHFNHEHPQQATSWTLDCIHKLVRITGAEKLLIHMRACGLKTRSPDGQLRWVKKPTYLMTSMLAALFHLTKTCSCAEPPGVLEGSMPGQGRITAIAQKYPDQLVDAMLKSIRLQRDGGGGGGTGHVFPGRYGGWKW